MKLFFHLILIGSFSSSSSEISLLNYKLHQEWILICRSKSNWAKDGQKKEDVTIYYIHVTFGDHLVNRKMRLSVNNFRKLQKRT